MAPKKTVAAKAAAKSKAAAKTNTVKDGKAVKEKDPWAAEPKAAAKSKPATKEGGNLPTAALKRMAGHLAYKSKNANPDIAAEGAAEKAVYDSATHAQKLEMLARFEVDKNTKFLSTFITSKGSDTRDQVKIRSGWMSKCSLKDSIALNVCVWVNIVATHGWITDVGVEQ